MKFPAQFIHNNLVWSLDDGTVWAFFSLGQSTYEMLSKEEKISIHARVKQALIGLPKRSVLLSTHREITPVELAERMTEGIDLVANPAWGAEVRAAADELRMTQGFERRLYLGVVLEDERGNVGSWTTAFESATASVAIGLGRRPPRPSDEEVHVRTKAAKLIQSRMQTSLQVSEVTPAEIRWLYARSVCRGITQPELDLAWDDDHPGLVQGSAVQTIMDGRFFEGGRSGDEGRPRHRKFLTIESEAGVSHQAFLAVSDMPHTWVYPGGGGEWFAAADRLDFPVDWAVTIEAVPNQDAATSTRKKARGLIAQVEEYEADPAGPPPSLAEAADGVEAQRLELSASPASPELRCSIILAVGAATHEDLETRVGQIQGVFEAYEYGLPRPTGGQLDLFRAMLPAARKGHTANDYLQYLMPRDLASGAPTAGTEVGDPTGMFLGHTLAAATMQPVLFDGAFGPSIEESGSAGLFGTLGSGKSYAIKRIAHAMLLRGGKIISLDRTNVGEYCEFAKGLPPEINSQIIRLGAGTDLSLDPARVFPTELRQQITVAFLTLLCQVKPTDMAGTTLAAAVEGLLKKGAPIGEIVQELRFISSVYPDADELALRIEAISKAKYAGMVFDHNRPAATWEADYLVMHTPGLDIPDRETVMNAHLAQQMLPEQVFAQAVLYLVAALARAAIFEDKKRFAAALLDEVWWLTSSVQGRKLLLEGLRDGRKHNAAVWMLSQTTEDLDDPRLTALLGNRMVFKQGVGAGAAALAHLGMDPTDEMTDLLENRLETGMCIFRDVQGRIAAVQVDKARPELHAAFNTNPASQAKAQVSDRRSLRDLVGA